jgi:2-oxoglutarate ferredoxin oxidoreductase subunit delta
MSQGTVIIDRDRCKGCDLCVVVCPPKVLEMSTDFNRLGYRYPILHDGCTGCTNCYKICPDIVFTVYRENRKVVKGEGE